MENKKDKNLLKSEKEKSNKKSSDYLATVKSNKYEDFEEVAKRLGSEGKLNEENYAKIKRNNKRYFTVLSLFLFVITAAFIGAGYWMMTIVIMPVVVGFSLNKLRNWQNKMCYLYTFGLRSDGIVINIKKDLRYGFIGAFILNMSLRACFESSIDFEFKDNNKVIRSSYTDSFIAFFRSVSVFHVGQDITVCYNKSSAKDALIFSSEFQYFNFLLKNN